MVYRWYCNWHNCASNWADEERCLGHCRVLFKTYKAAKNAAKRHVHWMNSGSAYRNQLTIYNPVMVEKVDGRRFKGYRIVE